MINLQQALERYPGSISFKYGDSAALNAEILALVRHRQKTVTCDALAGFEARGEALPSVGRTDIALDWAGKPALAVRTVEVSYVPFDQMPKGLVADQGEFRDLAHWRLGYQSYLTRAGLFRNDVMMLVERFEVVEDFLGSAPRSESQA